jgi:hypothetical protein
MVKSIVSEIDVVEKNNNSLQVYYDRYLEQLTVIENYEEIIYTLTEPFTADVKHKVRIPEGECFVVINEEKISIPPNGLVYVNEPEFIFGAYLHLNEWKFDEESPFRKLNYVFPHIKNFFPNIRYKSKNEISEKIELEIGECVEIKLNDYGQRVFGVDSELITIIYSDAVLKGKDYMPNVSLELEYSGGFENEGFIDKYDLYNDYYEYRNEQFAAFSYDGIIRFVDGAVILTEIDSPDYDGVRDLYDILLPKNIELNEKWMNDESELEITAVNVLIEVPYGKYKCIEVTTSNGDYSYTKYYAQGLGLVKVDFNGMIEELIDVRIK